MKRFAAILLTICLLYSAALAGSATVNVIEWSWFESTVTSQTEGSFQSIGDLPCKAWIPAVFEDTEKEPIEMEGISLFLFKRAEIEGGKVIELTFGKMDSAAYPKDKILQAMESTDYLSDFTPMIINGYDALRYKTAPENTTGFGMVYWLEDGTVLVIEADSDGDTFDESSEALFNYISFSVQPKS